LKIHPAFEENFSVKDISLKKDVVSLLKTLTKCPIEEEEESGETSQ
jgi:hypothetical protein